MQLIAGRGGRVEAVVMGKGVFRHDFTLPGSAAVVGAPQAPGRESPACDGAAIW